jgi:hypothetical protein
MRTLGSHLRPTRLVTVLACLAMAIPIVFASSTAAFADNGTITQTNPTQGGVLAGTAFTDRLQVSDATGTVTYVQTDGSDSVTVSSSGAVSAPGTLSAGTYTASGTDSDTSGDTGTWTYTLDVLQPAPDGFASTMVNVYQSEYAVVQKLGQASALQSVSAYQQQVSQLNAAQLAVIYYGVQQNPEWYQIPALMQTVASGIPATSASSRSAGASALPSSSASRSPSARRSSASRSFSAAASISADSSNDPQVHPYAHMTCDSGPSDAAVFALQIAIDAASGVYDVTAALAGVDISGFNNIAETVAAVISAIILTGAQVAHDTLSFQQLLASECSSNDTGAELDNIDNTTYQTYSLLTTVGSAVTQLQTTDNTTQQDVQNVQSSLSTMQTDVTQTITNDTQAMQTTVGSDTQGLTSQLQTDLTGLQQDLTIIEGDESTLSQDVGQLSNGTTTIQSALSSDLSKILSETDNDAAQLTSLVTQDNQQILDALKSNFNTQQGQYEANLKLAIERGLAEYGSTVPQVQFILPASQGGYLNSTPVGVQEVVTDDLHALQALGAKVTSAALNAFNAANAALNAKQYLTAYQDYATAYEDFA